MLYKHFLDALPEPQLSLSRLQSQLVFKPSSKIALAFLAPASHHPDLAEARGILNLKYVLLGNARRGQLPGTRGGCRQEKGDEEENKFRSRGSWLYF